MFTSEFSTLKIGTKGDPIEMTFNNPINAYKAYLPFQQWLAGEGESDRYGNRNHQCRHVGAAQRIQYHHESPQRRNRRHHHRRPGRSAELRTDKNR